MSTKTPRTAVHLTTIMALTVALIACQQTDGDVPEPTGEDVNKVGDIRRDLQAVSRGEAAAVTELRDDLLGLGPGGPPPILVDDLVSGMKAALDGRSLPRETAEPLAQMLFVTMVADELSEKQIAALTADVIAILTKAGAPEPAPGHVAAAVEEIQAAIGTNVRRFWQRR